MPSCTGDHTSAEMANVEPKPQLPVAQCAQIKEVEREFARLDASGECSGCSVHCWWCERPWSRRRRDDLASTSESRRQAI